LNRQLHVTEAGPPGGYEPVPTLLYVVGRNAAEIVSRLDDCLQYARARAWRITTHVVETTPDAPLEEREGWQLVTEALDAVRVRIVVVWSPETVGVDTDQFRSLQERYRDRDHVIVSVTASAPSQPPGQPRATGWTPDA
jgi:hypothetical protein